MNDWHNKKIVIKEDFAIKKGDEVVFVITAGTTGVCTADLANEIDNVFAVKFDEPIRYESEARDVQWVTFANSAKRRFEVIDE